MHDLTVIATDEATASCRKRHTTTVSSAQQPSPHHTSVPLSPRPSASRGRGRARGRSRTIPVSFSQPPLTSRWTKAAHRPGRDLLHFFSLSPIRLSAAARAVASSDSSLFWRFPQASSR